jgi:4-hydroxyphenylpyruvate dioxygenase-like putative hemolysin
VLEPLFEKMGFTLVARHRSKDVLLYRQGDINFIVNREPRSVAAYFRRRARAHACGLAFRVKDSHKAYSVRWSWAHSRWTSRPGRWNCACRRSRASAARRCT